MRHLYILFVYLSCGCAVVAQKPPVDSSVFGNWPSLSEPGLSANGNYVFFTVNNQPAGSNTLVLKDIHSSWEYSIEKGSDASFTRDSRSIILIKPPDSLVLLGLGASTIETIADVGSFKLSEGGEEQWLAYEANGPMKTLVLRNLSTGKNRNFAGITDYEFGPDGKAILIEQRQKDSGLNRLLWIDLLTDTSIDIWQGPHASNFVFDHLSHQLAFIADSASQYYSIWLFKWSEQHARLIVGGGVKGIAPDYAISSLRNFSKDGVRLFFGLKWTGLNPETAKGVSVDVWRYKDAELQSIQLRDLDPNYLFGKLSRDYEAVVDLDKHLVRQLEGENDTRLYGDRDSRYELMYHKDMGDKGTGEVNRLYSAYDLILTDTKSGERVLIAKEIGAPFLSPSGAYVVYYNRSQAAYYSYAIKTGTYRNLTKNIPATWTSATDFGLSDPETADGVIGVAGWLRKDSSVLLYDRYDIWKVDPAGRRPAENITHGFGRVHNISLRAAVPNNYIQGELEDSAILLLCAFNNKTKSNGFYSQKIATRSDPILLTMGPYIYTWQGLSSFIPLKAMDANLWLIQRMSVGESPNLFWTTNFGKFEQVTRLNPEKKYNWMTSELISWKTPDDKISQGLLYKPEDFDPKKKYPIIFYYYEKFSDQLNLYRPAEVSTDRLNVPYFVSNGYLVFIPDIHYSLGAVGQSAVNSVVSAAKYLAQKPWINAGAMGLQGHSFGGYETNYIITHSNIFAAAVSASGISDCISDYGTIAKFGGQDRASGYLMGHEGIRAPLWQRPDLYTKNSPLFSVKIVSTPVLMMSNKDDGIIDYSQGLEFYLALRQLGKKVWLLQYDGEGHDVYGDAAKDYTVRMVQFFGYYLKGLPAPRWMVKGIPASSKGIDSGFEYDNSGEKP
jgi:acetyl esterase/lipase